MKRSLTLLLTALALASGAADAGRRSGGGFGGSGGFRAPRSTPPRSVPRSNTYAVPRLPSPSTRTPSTAQRSTGSGVSAANRAAASRVTPAQLSTWKSVSLPAGVPRSALTYSATRTAQYPYPASGGRYYPYPQSYYRSHGIGSDLLRYALIYTAVSSVANAASRPDVIVNNVPAGTVVTAPQRRGPTVWNYLGVGLLAAAAGWFLLGRRR